jgi:hypothetical protein
MAKATTSKAATSKPKAQVMDVSHPGKTPPAENSKGVIITHRPMMSGPSDAVASEGAPEAGEPVASQQPMTHTSGTKPKLQPLSAPPVEAKADDAPAETKDAPAAAEPVEPEAGEAVSVTVTKTAAATPPAEPAPEASDPTPTSAETTPEPEAEPSSTEPAPSPTPDKTKTDEPAGEGESEADKGDKGADAQMVDPAEVEAAEQAKHDEAIQKLVDSKQYNLPINTIENRRTKRFVALGVLLALVLGVAWADIALDAGLVSVSGLPHTKFFSSSATTTATTTTSNAAGAPKTAPVVTSKKYDAPATKLTFHYPSNWEVSSEGSTATRDNIILGLTDADVTTDKTAANNITLVLSNDVNSTPAATPNLIVKSVKSQKLAHDIHGSVYLCDLIYQDSQSGGISVVSMLTNSCSVKGGEALPNATLNFTGADGKGQVGFEILPSNIADPTTSFTSVDKAQAFVNTTQYKQARSILLSLQPTPAKP